jgi:Xaa-Pro aminopeptidase
MRKAAQATRAGHLRIMRTARAGMFEYELQAILEYEFRRHGGCAPAYGSIVGSGDNATILHYVENDCRLTAGSLVLVDAGAEYQMYASDVTRTFPVDGTFTATQRHLYELVLEAQRQAIEAVRPGTSFTDGHDAAVWCLCEGLVDMRLAQGPVDQLLESGDYRRFYMHRTGHWLGLDVHDAGRYRRNQAPRSLEPGMVLTVEPGLYIGADRDDVPEEFRGIGVRIEDDVLVTPEGYEVLTSGIPKSIEEIETLRGAAVSH